MHLFFIKDVQSGLVWMTKILTDPFHDIMLYGKAPLYLLRGELIDPRHAQHGSRTKKSCEEQPRRTRSRSPCGRVQARLRRHAMREDFPQDLRA